MFVYLFICLFIYRVQYGFACLFLPVSLQKIFLYAVEINSRWFENKLSLVFEYEVSRDCQHMTCQHGRNEKAASSTPTEAMSAGPRVSLMWPTALSTPGRKKGRRERDGGERVREFLYAGWKRSRVSHTLEEKCNGVSMATHLQREITLKGPYLSIFLGPNFYKLAVRML